MKNPFRGLFSRSDAAQRALPAAPAGSGGGGGGGDKRLDGLINMLMGHGTGRDKRRATSFIADVISDEQAFELWRGNDLAKKSIETKVNDAVRNGYELKVGDDKDLAAEVADAMLKLGGDAKIADARKHERAYGGSALYPMINDGGDPSEPLNEDRITEIKGLILFEPRELQATRWYNDMEEDGKFGMPKAYRMFPFFANGSAAVRAIEVHESRLIVFPGIRHTRRAMRGVWPGWGDSTLTLIQNTLSEFDLSFSSVNALLNDLAQAVMSMDGLTDALDEGGEEDIKKKLAFIDLMRSTMRMVPIDAKDKLERKETPLSGVADILEIGMQRLASAFEMPFTKMWGRSPAGMNSTGQSDQDNWDDEVSAEQEKHLLTPTQRLLLLLMKSRKGPTNGKVPKKWSMEYRPLRQPTEGETAKARRDQAETDKIYIEEQVLSPEEVAHNRFGGDRYSFETVVDFKAREAGNMVVEPPVAPEPVVPPGLEAGAAAAIAAGGVPPAPGAPAQPGAEQSLNPQQQAAKAAQEAAKAAADSLPDRVRYDVLDVAQQKDKGVMLALYLPAQVARQVAIKNGVLATDLHVTLCYLGTDLPDVAIQRAVGVAYDAAMRRPPLRGALGGVGRFWGSTASAGKDAVYLSVDSPELSELQFCIANHLECLNVPVSRVHGYVPHVTVAYVEQDAETPAVDVGPLEFEFGAIVVAAGTERVILPFMGKRSPEVPS